MVKIGQEKRSSSGTAFSIDPSGVWMTARHVVDKCPKVYILTAPRQGMLVQRVYIHPRADIAFLRTRKGAPAVKFSSASLRFGQSGYHFGYPKGRPGDVSSRLIGRRVMRSVGRYRVSEPVIAWADRVRVPDTWGGLGGISGGPAFNSNGRIIGTTVAGSKRRGRIYTTAPLSIVKAFKRAKIALKRGVGRTREPIADDRFTNVARAMRRRLTVAKVICLVRRGARRTRPPGYRPRYNPRRPPPGDGAEGEN